MTVSSPPGRAARVPAGARIRSAARALPRGFVWCFLLGTLTASVWAFVTPSFQVPDEIPHAGYVQYLAETGRIPRPLNTVAGVLNPSVEEGIAESQVPFSYSGKPSWVKSHDRQAQRQLADPALSRKREEAAGAAANYPPLYYLLEAIPYKLASGGNFYDRLLAMRLFSALFAGLTAGFCFLFVRELLPRSRWAPLAAGTAVAFQPLMSFVSGGVNAEALLYAASAALFYAVARALRHGLTPKRGAAIGTALAVALLSKGTALAFVPALAFVLGLMLFRSRTRPTALGAAAAVAVAALPFLGWLVLSSALYHRAGSATTAGIGSAPPGATLTSQLGYVWQLYLPRLPFMSPRFASGWLFHDQWFPGFVGRLGYNQYQFAPKFNDIAWWGAIALVVLGCVGLVRGRSSVLRRWPEALSYLALTVCIMLAVGIAVFRLSPPGMPVTQSRYLLPLLPMYAGLIGLAIHAGGRRLGPALAAVIVVAAVAHNFAAIMLTLGRYYA